MSKPCLEKTTFNPYGSKCASQALLMCSQIYQNHIISEIKIVLNDFNNVIYTSFLHLKSDTLKLDENKLELQIDI